MITVSETGRFRGLGRNKKTIVELRGLSTDTKPDKVGNVNIDNGSIFIEIDTGKIYMYNLDAETWSEI